MTKSKIKSWLSRNFPFILFWFGTIVVVSSLIFAPFSRRSISADAASSVDSGSYYFSGFPAIYGYSDLGDVPVNVELKFGLWTPFACSSTGTFPVWLPYGFVYTKYAILTSDLTFYYDGGAVASASSSNVFLNASHGSGFYRYADSDYSTAFGTAYSYTSGTYYLTAYPQSAAVARSMPSLSSDPSSTSFPCYVYASPSLILDKSFTVGHSYTFQINVCLGDSFSDSELLFAGRDMVWNGSYFVSTSPLTWYRPSFIPDSLSSSSSYPLSVVVTPTSFFDATDEKYIYPFSKLEPSVPIPPPPPDAGYDAGYADGYDAGQKAGFDSGYDSGYSEGFNKGQSQQLVNPASSFLLPVQSFLSTDLFGTFSLGDAFSIVMFVLVAVIFIKMFAGG